MSNETKICEHCNVSCKNKYVLNTHLTKSKKCLEIRGLSLSKKYICKGCSGIFSNNTNLKVHTESCKEYTIFMMRYEYQEKISIFQKEMKDTISEMELKHSNFISEMQKTHQKELKDTISEMQKTHLKETQMFQQEKLFLEKQLLSVQTSFERVTKEAFNRPTKLNENQSKR